MDAMVGKVEVGYVAASFAFGEAGRINHGRAAGLLLVSTVSAMILAGPRVLHRIGQDFALFRRSPGSMATAFPPLAVMTSGGLGPGLPVVASFDRILVFSGATMALNTFVTVLGVFVLRWRRPGLSRPFRTWLYPLPPLIFLLITGWTLWYIVLQRPVEAMISLVYRRIRRCLLPRGADAHERFGSAAAVRRRRTRPQYTIG
jgi:APA family basic amino acid/polyamine antiporter